MKYVENDTMIRLRAYANCSSLDAWPTTVTVRLELCHDLRQELETTIVLCAWHCYCKARVASECHMVGR